MAGKNDWRVCLGEQEWARHTYARASSDEVRLLGSVQRGPRVGALGVTRDGRFVQVNGDHVSELGASQVRAAIARAETVRARPVRRSTSTPQPTIIIVKRRRAIQPR